MSSTQKITTFLWYDGDAEEAAHYYASVFDDASVLDPVRTPEEMASDAPPPMLVSFEIAGQRFMALNGGPQFHFTEAVSLYVDCADQAEVDRYWNRFIDDGGEPSMCGWLKDKYGLSWQIIPTDLQRFIGDPDPEKAGRAIQAMLKMSKIDVEALRAAHAGE
ncbi:MAG: VOC family protein [Planctomycetes bacterium]|nr:VOC family protein [Planctomycetota bacterium]MCB9904564.1 VOC family protein [Planctomycetota bacterium]